VGVGSEHADAEFTPEEEASAFDTNRTMCMCQVGISLAQLTVCALQFKDSPLRNGVNVGVCAVSLPLAVAGLTALADPEAPHAVLTMHWYQFFFLLRALLVSFDYGFLVDTRAKHGTSTKALVLATVVLVAILMLQVLNSLLVMAVIRIMRKRRNQAAAREAAAAAEGGVAKAQANEATPLLGSSGYAPPAPVA
jgi:hypothetical protein